jgi:hypothetical protein
MPIEVSPDWSQILDHRDRMVADGFVPAYDASDLWRLASSWADVAARPRLNEQLARLVLSRAPVRPSVAEAIAPPSLPVAAGAAVPAPSLPAAAGIATRPTGRLGAESLAQAILGQLNAS